MIRTFLWLVFAGGLFGQVFNPSIVPTPSSPAGLSCGPTSVTLFYPSGALYTCQSGVYAAVGGGATIPSTTNLISGNGSGSGADSGIAPSTVVKGAAAVGGSANLLSCAASAGTLKDCTQALLPLGSSGSVGLAFSGDAAGWYRNASNQWTFQAGGTSRLSLFDSVVRIGNIPIGWSGVDSESSADTGVSRVSAGVLGIGNGTQGDVSGTASMTGLIVAGSTVTYSGLGSATGTPDSVCLNTNTLKRNAALTCTVSSRDFKTGIESLATVSASSLLMQLEPVQFAYNDHAERTRWGFISEQVAGVDRRLADGWDAVGVPRSLDQNAILAVTVKTVQEQQQQIKALSNELEKLKDKK
jgi:hypothetical protein